MEDVNKVHCAVEHALLLRYTVSQTAVALEAASIAPAVLTRLGEYHAPLHAVLDYLQP
jgi:hypothetical protein